MAASMFQMRGVKPLKRYREVISIAVILTITPTGLFLSILKPFIIPLGFTVTAIICHLTTLKNCMRGLCLCRQLSWQNFSFYFVLILDTGPYVYHYSRIFFSTPYNSLIQHFIPTIFLICVPIISNLYFYS